ncbi:DNA repair protein XRCC2-like [Mercenaria mercenaria]|uniref:DNA repair protein XRCC2-like n=1 Tax=Mercenaria mercenaria TaxID=6596 RepID=UPI00234F58EC|nr:DNA repair protein XRCC2-like [Mercenaria mercenaria]
MATKETGIQFLARLGSRPSLTGIQPIIFGEQGPQTKDVIELYGGEGTGKTELLVHLICRCILPEYWNNVPLDGHGAGVVFIDTDFKFSVIRLVTVIEKYILDKARDCSKFTAIDSDSIESFIRECLKKLHILRCTSSEQLVVTLHNLENLICNESSVSVIMIDSISTFYWIDKSNGGDSIQAQESNMKYVTEILSKLINTYNLTLLVTKAVVYKKKGQNDCFEGESGMQSLSKHFANQDLELFHAEFMCKPWQRLVSHRLVLVKDLREGNQEQLFVIGGDCAQGNQTFKVCESGIKFLS